ncbi:hypothetical protein LEP1GSC042_0401 [Leptospira kirschneri serovar Bim str. PUO 1247]|nr:hypothetical protein LEP1GSC042_0401 [Leptospira kirschneri serovar Bim str. PUO 1247]
MRPALNVSSAGEKIFQKYEFLQLFVKSWFAAVTTSFYKQT